MFEARPMGKVQQSVIENLRFNKKKNCTDCLHCKVSSCSTRNSRLCFCSKDRQKVYDIETYWLSKAVCRKFEDMSA